MKTFRQFTAEQRANEEFTPQELDYMRRMLDDEDVSPEVKNNFLYALANAGRLSEEEIDRYAPQVGADPSDVKWGGQDLDENMRNARSALTTARGENIDGDVRRAYENLGGGGFSTSDEIIDQAEVVLRMFEEFYPRYEQARQLVEMPVVSEMEASEPPTVDMTAFTGEGEGVGKAEYPHTGIDPQSLRNGLDEFRGIDFAAFRADAQMLRSAHDAIAEKADALDTAWKDTDDWTGDAKAAAEQVNKNLSSGSEKLREALSQASEGLAEAIGTQESAVVEFAEALFRSYETGKIAGMTVGEVDECIHTVVALPQLLSSYGALAVFIEDEANSAIDEAKNSLTAFCQGYQQKASEVHKQAKNYVERINQNYALIVQGMGQALQPDPFADPGGAGIGQPQLPDVGAQPGGPGGAGSGGMPGGGMPGGGAPGGGMPGGGAGVPSAEDLMPETTDTPTNPVTGEPLETDPETGKPYPIDPETGEAIKDADAPGTLTVEQGEQTFTMTEPDDGGAMSITVEGGDGELGEYQLDFGTGETTGDESQGGAAEGFGPRGADETAQQVYRPGPDGKIHINDGDLRITAEQPDGPEGPTVVTVDNGKGEPVTYTLGNAEREGTRLGDDVGVLPADSDPELDPRNTASSPSNDAESSAGGQGGGNPGSGNGTGGSSAPSSEFAHEASGAPSAPAPEATAGPDDDVSTDAGESDDSSATHAQAVAGGAGGSAFAGGGGGGDAFALDQESQEPGVTDQSRSSGAGLGTAPGGEVPTAMPPGNGAGASAGGGMGMMGGMGAMGGGGGGQGGDQERTSSAYRIEGNIFEMSGGALRVSGVLGEDNEVPVRFTR